MKYLIKTSTIGCKNFKNRVRKLVSKRQVGFVKEGVIGYIIP